MLKTILNLENVKKLSKNAKKKLKGGGGIELIAFQCCGLPHYVCDQNTGCQWEGSHCGYSISHLDIFDFENCTEGQ